MEGSGTIATPNSRRQARVLNTWTAALAAIWRPDFVTLSRVVGTYRCDGGEPYTARHLLRVRAPS